MFCRLAVANVLRDWLHEHRIRDCLLLVGVSGGSDSVALLHLLASQQREFGLGLHVAHLDHRLRGSESAGDAEFVRGLAAELSLPATIAARDVKRWREAHGGGSLEAAARAVRLAFLEKAADDVDASWIVLGHTADDQAETVLLNLVRGAGLSGLRGMRPVRDRLLRPLLGVKRAELRRMLEKEGLGFRTDSSNLSLKYRRNRMRQEVLPLLADRFNPRVVPSIVRSAAILGRIDAWLTETCDELLCRATPKSADDRLEIELRPLHESAEPIREHAVKLAVDRLLGQAGELANEHVEAILRLVEEGAPGRLQLPGGLIATVTGDRLRIGRGETAGRPTEWELRVRIPGRFLLHSVGRWIVLDVLDRPEGFPSEPQTEPHESYMDLERLGPEPRIRNRRAGDRFRPLGAPGSSKLKEFFIDQKIPQRRRAAVPLLADELGIACVLGYRISERMKVTPKTRRLLHVRLEEAAG